MKNAVLVYSLGGTKPNHHPVAEVADSRQCCARPRAAACAVPGMGSTSPHPRSGAGTTCTLCLFAACLPACLHACMHPAWTTVCRPHSQPVLTPRHAVDIAQGRGGGRGGRTTRTRRHGRAVGGHFPGRGCADVAVHRRQAAQGLQGHPHAEELGGGAAADGAPSLDPTCHFPSHPHLCVQPQPAPGEAGDWAGGGGGQDHVSKAQPPAAGLCAPRRRVPAPPLDRSAFV